MYVFVLFELVMGKNVIKHKCKSFAVLKASLVARSRWIRNSRVKKKGEMIESEVKLEFKSIKQQDFDNDHFELSPCNKEKTNAALYYMVEFDKPHFGRRSLCYNQCLEGTEYARPLALRHVPYHQCTETRMGGCVV